MCKKYFLIVFQVLFLGSFFYLNLSAQVQTLSEGKEFRTAESVVTELYKLVTFETDSTPDWQKVKSLFIDEAIIVLRTSRENTTIFSVEGFVDDFINFIERANVKQTGFVEKIIRMKMLSWHSTNQQRGIHIRIPTFQTIKVK